MSSVSVKILESVVLLYEESVNSTGSIEKKSSPGANKKITPFDEFMIFELVLERPGIYLHEITNELQQSTGTDVSVATVCRVLQKAGFSRTKIQHIAIQQSRQRRAHYILEMQQYRPEMLVFIDETGTDRRDCLRKFGYSLIGKRTISKKLIARGRHVSAIAAMSMTGILDFRLVHGGVDNNSFQEFVDNNLLRHLVNFNGINEHSIIIMDNASIHHAGFSVEVIESIGCLVMFLPPYSPDLNPIEEVFSSVKSFMKANESILQVTNDIEDVVTAAFANISSQQCQAWINDAGYM